MVKDTARKMAEGGMYDQLGGGFHRYSVDAQWLVPHFEKMLYDNAQLVELTATIAWENYRARFDHAFGIEAQGFSEGAFCAVRERPAAAR